MVDRLARALFDMGRDVAARDVKGRTPSRPSSQVSSLLPPPPRLSLSNVLDTATSQVNRAVATPPQQNQPQRLNIPTVTERREEPDAWGVYETNYGPVAMPASWGEAAGYRQQGDLITDPQQLERAKNSNYAYTKLPEEQQREIRMPVLEGRADNAVREVTDSVAGGIAPFIRDEAKKQLDAASRIGSGAVTGGIEKALKIRDELPEREEPQDEQAFAVVRNNQTNSTHLVRREDLEAAPEGTFTVITPNVNAQEAQSMMDAGLLQEGEAPVIRGPEDLGGEVVDPGEQASLAQSVLRQQQQEAERQAQEEAEAEQRRQEAVVEINGHLFPAGTTAPGQYTLENIESAPMPEGYVWVTDIGSDNPYLVPVQRDDTGQLIAPEGTVLVAGTAPATTQSENYPDWLKELRSDPNMVIGGYLEQGGEWVMDAAGWVNDTVSGIVPQNFKDWWNENVEKPLDIAIRSGALDGVAREFESIPIVGPIISGILRNPTNQQLMQSFADNPLSGIIQIIAAPQQALVVNVVDHEINKILGREDSGFSDSAGQVGSVVFENAPFLRFITEDLQVWIRQNPDEAVDLYENGYDVDDDGTPDLYGGDAVYQYWMDNETGEGAAGIFYRLIFETGSDPLTWAAGAGALGRGVNLLGRGIRMADNAGPIRQTVGGLTEGVGTAIHVAGRTGEVIGDFGAEYVLQGATWVLRKTKIIGESPAARREADMTDFEEATEGATRQDKVVSEGDTITLDENGNAVEIEHADGTTTTIDGPQRPPAPEGVETGTVLEQDYYNTRIVRGEDTWEVQVLNNDGQWVTRTKSKSLDNARKWETRYQQRATTASGGGRWERAAPEANSQKFIDQIPQEQYDALRAALGDQWAQSEDIMASIGRGNPLPEHALESSRIARVTLDTAEDIAQGQPLPEWGLNTSHYVGAPYYQAMETAIRRAWTDPEGVASRSMLSGEGAVVRPDGLRIQARTPIISSEALPRGRRRVSQKRIRAANNYVDMMHEHAKWHPESFRDSSFNEAWQRAVDLDYALRQRGQRRSYNGVEREPLTAVRVPDGLMFTPEVQRGAARATNEPGPSPQRAAEPEGETWTIEDPDNPRNNGTAYRVTEDIWIEVHPVNAGDVPTQWLRTYPDHRGRWYSAIVKGDNHTADNLIVTYAPTEAEALGLARETLRARGLIPGESGGLDVVADVNRTSGDVVRMRQGPEQPRPHLTSRGLPKAGESREWNGIPVRAVDIDGETVYIFDTNDGPFAIRRENGKAVAVDPAAASEGRLVEMVWDGGRAINMRDAGRHIYRMHEQAATPDVPAGDVVRAADAPETVDTTPDTPAAPEAPTGARIGDGVDEAIDVAHRHVDTPYRDLPPIGSPERRAYFEARERVQDYLFNTAPDDHPYKIRPDLARDRTGTYGAGIEVRYSDATESVSGRRGYALYDVVDTENGATLHRGVTSGDANLYARYAVVDKFLRSVGATPERVAPSVSAAPRPRMTPETRRQRVARIRSSRKRQMREVRQSREAVVNARVRALYGEVQTEGGLRADVLAPPVRRFDPPEATTPDPSGTFEMPRGETPDPEGRPAWADPNVPEIAPEAEKAVMRGARRGGGSIPADPTGARGGAHRIRKKVIVKPGQGKKASLSTNHFVQEQGVTGKAAAPERQYWMGHPMTDDYVDALTRHTFPEGDTPMERISTRAERYAANDNYRQDMAVYEWQAIQDTKADYAKLLAEVHQNWGARQVRKGVAKLPEPARKALEAFGRALRGVLGVWDSTTTFRRERMLFSHERALAYPLMQYFGNAAQLAAGGKFFELFKGANPRNINRYRKQLLRQATTVEEAILLDPASTNYMKLQVKVGAPIPREVRDIYQGMLNNLNDPLELERWLKAVNPQLGKLGKLSGSKKYALWGGAIDASFRDAVGHGKMVRTLREEAIPDFSNQTQMRLMDWGLSREEARQLWREFTDSYDGPFFDSNRVRQFFEPHVGEGRAVRLQRDWQGAVNKADKIAREDIRKFTFASPRTNADEVLGRLFLFHHFMTRQSNYYANLVARHPAMLNLYFNIEEELRNEDWPDFLDGWVPSFTIFGRQFFLNPTYVFSSYLFFNDRQSFEEEDVTGAGRVLNWFNDIVGVNAIIMDVANLTGVLGDTNAPDIFGFRRETNTLTTLFNWGRAYGIIGDDPTPVANPELQFSFNLRERLSGWLPGTEEIRAIDVEARMDWEINKLVVDELQREDPDFDIETPEGQELFIEVTSDPENEIYQRALKRYVNGEVAEIVTRFFAGPLAPRNRMVNEDGEDLYRSFSRDVKNIVNVSDPRVQELNLQADRYYDIGTERDREIAGLWNQVAFGHVHHPITVDGVTYSPAEIYHMNTEQRIALADGLLQEHGLLDDYKELQDERKRFLAQPENAEYAQFYTWRKEVNDYDGGVEKYWQDAIDGGNESARLYYEDVMSQPLTYEQRHQRLTSMYGFMQLKGYHTSVWDPAPVQMHGVFDPVNVANQAPQPIPYEEPNAEFRNEVRKAPEQLAELQEWDNKVKQVQSEMGIDPSIPFNELDTQTRIAIEEELEARGHKEPSLSWQVKKYVEWAEQQPPGADTSIEAFFEASDREYREGAPARVQEKMNKPEPAPGPDRYGNQPTSSPSIWVDILNLINEHDHKRYGDDSSSSGGSGSSSSGHWLLPYLN